MITFLGPGGDLGLGFSHGGETVFASPDFCRQVDTIGDIGLVGLFRQGEQFLHFGLQLCFQLLNVPVRERAVARGVGLHLGAVQADIAEFEQFHFPGQFEHLNEQLRELAEKSVTEGRQRVVVRVSAGGKMAEGYRRSGSITASPGDGPSSRALRTDS